MPFVNTTYCSPQRATRRAIQLAVLTLANVKSLDAQVTVRTKTDVWTSDGMRTLGEGRYSSAQLRSLYPAGPANELVVDELGRSVITSESVSGLLPVAKVRWWRADAFARLRQLVNLAPWCSQWVYGAVRIIIPRKSKNGRHSSASDPRFPGVVWVDPINAYFIPEGVIHEAADKYFDYADSSKCVDPAIAAEVCLASPPGAWYASVSPTCVSRLGLYFGVVS